MPKKGKTKTGSIEHSTEIKKTRSSKYQIFIDHPKNGEEITYKAHYAIRIGTPNQAKVEVSIDSGEYQQCRFSSGYWWYDWCNIPPGKHKIVARLVDPQKNRTLKKSAVVECLVK